MTFRSDVDIRLRTDHPGLGELKIEFTVWAECVRCKKRMCGVSLTTIHNAIEGTQAGLASEGARWYPPGELGNWYCGQECLLADTFKEAPET